MRTENFKIALPYCILALLTIYFLLTHSPNLELDIDPSYILASASRPLLYPLFISLFRGFHSYQYIMIMWCQAVLIFSALLYGRYWLKKNLKISDALIFLIFAIILLTISFHFQIWSIQSEGLSFPLFILTFFACVECFYKFSLKNIFYFSFLVSLLVLTRLQFIYFYVVYVILCLWYIWKRVPIKPLLISFFILFGTMSATLLIDHSYHYFKHGFFGKSPYDGLMILVQALYLADNDAAGYFKDSQQKLVVQSMIDQRNQQGLNQATYSLSSFRPSAFEYAYQGYARNYLAIQNIINRTLKTSIENTGYQTNFEANKIARDIDKTLIFHNMKMNVLFTVWKFLQCLGGIPQCLFLTILLLYIPLKIFKDKIKSPALPVIFIINIVFLTFLNAFIIALCNPDLPVYFCYSQFMLYCLAALLVNQTILKSDSNLTSSNPVMI